ncbi:MAG: efflux RND transporter periplasmic adaptor subunit [Rhodospirillales bacterium]|nr:efflux RND transporter periplasmic adaptor subunit [Rhodospirillales bacterium]
MIIRHLLLAAGLLCPAAAFAQSPAQPAEHAIPAQLVSVQRTVLSAEIPAKIEKITVKEGDRFDKGQVLVAFDCALQRAQLTEAQALAAAAEKTRSAHARLLQLNATGELDLAKATSEAVVAKAKVNSAEVLVSKCAIAAPFAGRVAERKAEPHQYAQAGQALLEILDDGALEAEFIVPSAWAPKLKNGMAVNIVVDETKKTYPARIVRLGAKVDAVSHSVKIAAAIENRYPELLAGMSGGVRVSPP